MREISTTLRVLITIFTCEQLSLPSYLPLVNLNTQEIFCSKGHFTSLKTIVHKNHHESVAFILLPDVL